jgi:energy-coupling factor transporter ATP-binding protein EcfA2
VLAGKRATLAEAHKQYIEQAGQLQLFQATRKELGELGLQPKVFYDKEEDAIHHRSTVSSLQTQLAGKVAETDPYDEQIEEMKTTALAEIDYTVMNELMRVKEHQEFLLKLLTNKDSFIRKRIIDQNLSYLNARLGYYLDKIGLPHTVKFLNDLSVEIQELGRELDFDNLSRGERNRLILSLSWAFRDVWESLYQPINLLFIDELVDSGMDTSGVENALAILKKMTRENNKSIWLVSHKDELAGRVNNILTVVKENGFTTYNNDVEVK